MTQDRLSALQAVKAGALALAAKAKALGLDAATVDQLAATVSAGLTEAAVKTRAPDSWRVTVRRYALVPVDVVLEVIAENAGLAEAVARDEMATNRDGLPAGGTEWDEDANGDVWTGAVAVEPVWEPVAAPVEPEPAPVDMSLGLSLVEFFNGDEPEEPVKVEEPVRIGPEPIAPAPKDDGIYSR